MKLVALFSHIRYFSVYFYHHQFHFQTNSTTPFYIRSGQVAVFLWLIFAVILFKPPLAVCVTVYCISIPVWIYIKFFLSWHLNIGWLHASVFSAFCLHQDIVIFSSSFCGWRSIWHSHGTRSGTVQVTCLTVGITVTQQHWL